MDKNTKIKLTKDINITELDGEKVMVDFETGKYFIIKGCGNDIWDMLSEEISPAEIIDKLLAEYDVSREECEQSVMDFLGKMEEYNFI
ncbi:Coenzyme PQQ synthesis protein D (PqqD) [Lachnospiraceae bacterium YSD2013]|nr:Coenzyme PQQ synthesis protein D (PqqD) [Lachnospiraceae bacterium YSD2013]